MEKGRGVGASAELDQSEVNVTASMMPKIQDLEDPLIVGVVPFRQGDFVPVMQVEAPLLRVLNRTKSYPLKSPHQRGAKTFPKQNANLMTFAISNNFFKNRVKLEYPLQI